MSTIDEQEMQAVLDSTAAPAPIMMQCDEASTHFALQRSLDEARAQVQRSTGIWEETLRRLEAAEHERDEARAEVEALRREVSGLRSTVNKLLPLAGYALEIVDDGDVSPALVHLAKQYRSGT
jgi:DNA repair exonuclease SbcCD ATPase subunit